MAEVNLKLLYGDLKYRSEDGVWNVRFKSSAVTFIIHGIILRIAGDCKM